MRGTDGAAVSAADRFRREAEHLRDHAPDVLRRVTRGSAGRGDLFYEHTISGLTTLRQRVVSGRVTPAVLSAVHSVRSGAGLRLQTPAQTLYASSTDTSPEGLDALADGLPPIGYPHGDRKAGVSEGRIQRVERVEPSAGALVREAADAALSIDASLVEVTVRLQETTRRTLIVTSDGRAAQQIRSNVSLRIDVVGQGQLRAYAIDGAAGAGADLLYCDPGRVAAEAVDRATILAEAHPLPPGQMPVVIAGGWGGVWLHEAAGHLLEADVLAARSAEPPIAMLGRRIAASGVTLIDDASLIGGRGTYAFDDEGMPGQATVLVEDGIVRGILTDRQHAVRYGLQPTGNGRRQDFRFAPIPRMTNLVLQPGDASPEDLILDADDGLFVTMIGSGLIVPEEDRFTFDVLEGFRIEGGRLTGPVTGVSISGRASTVLERIAGIGNDLTYDHARGVCVKHGQAVPVSTGMPTVFLSSLDVHSER